MREVERQVDKLVEDIGLLECPAAGQPLWGSTAAERWLARWVPYVAVAVRARASVAVALVQAYLQVRL